MWVKTLFSTQSNKAWLSALSAALTALIAGNHDGTLDLTDWLTAASAAVVALGLVYGVGNATAKKHVE